MADEIISRREAFAKELTRYFTGQPCKHGHVALRLVSNGCCTACTKDIETRYRDSHREQVRAKWRRHWARADEDEREKHREVNRRYASENKDKVNVKKKAWLKRNPDKASAMYKRYNDAHKPEIAIKNKQYKTEHKERLAPINRARVKQWLKDNPEAKRKFSHARRSRVKGAPGAHTTAELLEILKRQKWKCAEETCRTSLRKKRHLDHIVAISKGGSNDANNLQYLCPSCNCRKHDKDPIVWAQENGRLL